MLNPGTKLYKSYVSHIESISEAKLVKQGIIDDGRFFEFEFKGFTFGCVLQKLNDFVKVSFYFFDPMNHEEERYWVANGYDFRLWSGSSDSIYNHTIGVLRLNGINTEFRVKAIMFKQVNTLLKFRRDFKYILSMFKAREYEPMIKDAMDKQFKRCYL